MATLDGTMALMTAIRAALLADSALLALGCDEVLDRAKPSMSAPYITIGQTSFADWSGNDFDGQDFRIDVSVWDQSVSQLPDTLRARQIMERVRIVLHFATLTLADPYRCPMIQNTASVGPLLDPDGSTIHGICTFRALVDHT